MLDLIGAALKSRGILFCRIDGRSSMSQRKEALETFASDSGCGIMLASIGAAGEGYTSSQNTRLSCATGIQSLTIEPGLI